MATTTCKNCEEGYVPVGFFDKIVGLVCDCCHGDYEHCSNCTALEMDKLKDEKEEK